MDTTCDVCGSTDLHHLKCKVICRHCGTILRSCADLAAPGGAEVGVTVAASG